MAGRRRSEESIYGLVTEGARVKGIAVTSATVDSVKSTSDHSAPIVKHADTAGGLIYGQGPDKKKASAKDHTRDNIRAVREQGEINRLRKEAGPDEREEFKLAKFKNVPSSVASQLASAAPAEGHDFMKKGASNATRTALTRRNSSGEPSRGAAVVSTKPSVPRAHETNTVAPREQKDFKKINFVNALDAKPKPAPAPTAVKNKTEPKHAPGAIPKYMEGRKQELAAAKEAKERAMRPSDCPPGMVLLPEADRLETLAILEENKAKFTKELMHMPITVTTETHKRKVNELNKKLEEIEEAIRMFSKAKVYVADD